MIGIYPFNGIGEVSAGDDLVQILLDAMSASNVRLRADDVVVVTQKIVSKVENRYFPLADVEVGAEARRLAAITYKDARLVELVLAESIEVIRAARGILITRHRLGHVMANSGIDRSNVGTGREEQVLLLPEDPDRSAEALRAGISNATGIAPAILISDSFGRPWRHGVVGVAIGAAGLPALLDRRGEHDRDGRILEVTQIALGDVLATAAGLVCGEGAEGIPAALIRGVALTLPARPAAALVRPVEEDLFR